MATRLDRNKEESIAHSTNTNTKKFCFAQCLRNALHKCQSLNLQQHQLIDVTKQLWLWAARVGLQIMLATWEFFHMPQNLCTQSPQLERPHRMACVSNAYLTNIAGVLDRGPKQQPWARFDNVLSTVLLRSYNSINHYKRYGGWHDIHFFPLKNKVSQIWPSISNGLIADFATQQWSHRD